MMPSSWVKSAFERIARRRGWLEYPVAAAASIGVAWRLLHLRVADLRVPFSYEGDALAFGLLLKSIVDHGWYLTNPHLSAPGVLQLHDFPFPDIVHLLVWKAMSWFTSDWALIFNVYFLLGFPLITLSSLAVLRHFRVGYATALAVSLLYAFLPSRLLKGENHYFLDMFYQVPLAILVALWVCGDRPPLVSGRGGGGGAGARDGGAAGDGRNDRVRSWAALGICVLTAGTGLYYAFFSGVLITVGGLWASVRRRTARNALAGLALTAVIVAGLGVQGIPTLLHNRRQGSNHEVASRTHADSEVFGMRLAQLLLPVPGHRVTVLRDLRKRYDRSAPFFGEGSVTALGVVASVGFLALLALLLLGTRSDGRGSPDQPREDLLRPLAVFNLTAVLLATMGGVGSMLALIVTPEVRTYSRMHVVIAFLSLFAVALLIERAGRRLGRWAPLVPPLVIAVGLFDQITPAAVRPYQDTKVRYQQDASFVHTIEAALPAGAMVLELPYVSFPEAMRAPGQRLEDYELLKSYFHSRALHWSHPAMRGRVQDAWIQKISLRAPAWLVTSLTAAGFDAILINRRGYADSGAELEKAIARELGAPPIVGSDGRLAFFSLVEHARRLHAGLSAAALERQRDLAQHPIVMRFTSGCSGIEHGKAGDFRWCGAIGEIDIDNDARVEQAATLTTGLFAGKPPTKVTIEGDLLAETVDIPASGQPFVRTLRVAPGSHRLRFRAVGQPVDAPEDSRWPHLIWGVQNPRLEEIAPAP